MSEYQAVIGIECHVQLDTRTKIFCACPLADGDPANTCICSVCTGQPGTLPTVNDAAVRLGIRAGLAIGCTVHAHSVFARKNYFYPDLPKGYQITQYENPLCTEGALHVKLHGEQKRFGITRLHLEEDAGKLTHTKDGSFVDWNRAGTPLAEIVSEPDLRSSEEAEAYARMLHRVMVEARVTRGDMEKGHMRFDANVSVHKPGTPFGTRVEIKNLNSFRFLRRAIDSERGRQIQVLENGGTVYQETRLWTGQETATMRSKEGAADYRYFPDPDLPPIALDPAELVEQLLDLPEAPLDLFLLAHDQSVLNAWQSQFGLAEDMVLLLTSDPELATFFQDAVAAGGDIRAVSNWMQSEILGWINASNAPLSESALSPSHLVVLLRLLDEGVIGRPVAKQLLEEVFAKGGDLEALVQERGLARMSDESALGDVVRAAIADNPEQAQRYRDGNPKVAGFFMGLVMKATGGRADPAIANRLVRDELDK